MEFPFIGDMVNGARFNCRALTSTAKMHPASWIYTFTATSITLCCNICGSIILARSLGVEHRGLLLSFTFWPALLFSIIYISLNESIAITIAERPDKHSRHEAISSSILSTLIWLLTVSLIYITIATAASIRNKIDVPLWLISYTYIFSLLTAFDLCFKSIINGQHNIISLNAARLAQPLFYILFLSFLSYTNQLDVRSALYCNAASIAISAIIAFVLARLNLSIPSPHHLISLFRTAISIHRINILLYITSEADKLIVVSFFDSSDVGLYAVAVALSSIAMSIVIQSVTLLVVPLIGRSETIQEKTSNATLLIQISILISFLINLFGTVALPAVVRLLYGTEFADSVPFAIILLWANSFRGIRVVVDYCLRSIGDMRLAFEIQFVGSSLLVVGFLGAYFGLKGVCYAMFCGQLLALIYSFVRLYSQYHINAMVVRHEFRNNQFIRSIRRLLK